MGEEVSALTPQEGAKKALAAIRDLIRDIQLPATLHEIGVQETDLQEMARIAMPILESLPWNPRTVSLDELVGVYRQAL